MKPMRADAALPRVLEHRERAIARTNDNREWGTVILAGYDGRSPLQLDTFMLGKNIAKAESLVRGIWKQERALEVALGRANAATTSRRSSARSTTPISRSTPRCGA